MENIPYWFVVIMLSVLGFFAIRFYYLVDEIRRDVKQVLIEEAERKQIVANIKEDVAEFKIKLQELEKKINYFGRELERIKR